MVRPAVSMIDFQLSKLCRACSSKVARICPLGARAACPETYRNSPAKMPGLYGPTGFALAGKTTRLSALPARRAQVRNSAYLFIELFPGRSIYRFVARGILVGNTADMVKAAICAG